MVGPNGFRNTITAANFKVKELTHAVLFVFAHRVSQSNDMQVTGTYGKGASVINRPMAKDVARLNLVTRGFKLIRHWHTEQSPM